MDSLLLGRERLTMQPSLIRFALALLPLASLAAQAQDSGAPVASFESLGRKLDAERSVRAAAG